jgi:ABC-type phosphate/phosphonate transport system substrate-binding protein
MNLKNLKQTEKLADIREEGIDALKELSERLNNEQSILDCSDMAGLEQEEMDALFDRIRPSWRTNQELHNFVIIETFNTNGLLRGEISEYINRSPTKNSQNKPLDSPNQPQNEHTRRIFPLIIAAVGMSILGLTFLALSYEHSSDRAVPITPKPLPTVSILETNKLTIGVLGDAKLFTELKSYLYQKFGDRVQIQFEGNDKTSYQIAKDKIANNEWDIVFTLSPIISIAAQDNHYTWAAKMFADQPPFYQSVFFVRANSPIKSLEDMKPKTVIALGDFNSASSFYMPSYTLYGKKLTVDRGHRGREIRAMVKSGKADVGVVGYPERINDNDLEFRIINKSRNIPGSGVYLSPKLSSQDRELLKYVLLKDPQSVTASKQANYGAGEEPDYSQFKQITNRVQSMLTCVDWSQKQISFYCPDKETGIMGKVISALPASTDSNQARLELKISDVQTYTVLLPLVLINQIPGGGSLLNLKNKQVRLIDVKPSKGSDGKLKIKIDRASQIKIQQ